MKKAIIIAALLVASTAGAWDYTARQEWQMFLKATGAEGGRWDTRGIDRPGAIRLILPCGSTIHWGFPVRVQAPITWVSFTGTESVTNTNMAPEYVTEGPITFDQVGTYILRHGDPGHTMLYVQTTCAP